MLLSNWLQEMTGIEQRVPFLLDRVRHFGFGESYEVVMQDNRVFEDRDLDRILQMMIDEFNVWNSDAQLRDDTRGKPRRMFGAKVEFVRMAMVGRVKVVNVFNVDPLSQPSDVHMCVIPQVWVEKEPVPVIEDIAEQVRHNVTLFSLSGSWDAAWVGMKKERNL